MKNEWTPLRLVILAIVTFVLVSLLAVGITAAREQVFGATGVSGAQLCDGSCSGGAQQAVRDFRHGRLGHAHGFKPGNFFVHPKWARTYIIRHINRFHRRHPGLGMSPTMRTAMRDGICPSNYGVCVYNSMTVDSGCVATNSYPASLSGHGCDRTAKNHELTNQQVASWFDWVACEGAVGVVSFYAMPLPPEPVPALVIAASGSATCSVHLWYALTFG